MYLTFIWIKFHWLDRESFEKVLAMVVPFITKQIYRFLQHDFTQQSSLRHLELWLTWASNPLSLTNWLIWLSPIHTFHRTRWGICLSWPKISNMTDIFLSALRGEILTKTRPHTRGNSWANCLARPFAELFPLVFSGHYVKTTICSSCLSTWPLSRGHAKPLYIPYKLLKPGGVARVIGLEIQSQWNRNVCHVLMIKYSNC